MNEKILGTEKVSKLFIKYTLPAVISMVLTGSQTLIGGMILGNYVGPNALAAVNIVNPFIQLAMAFSMVIAFGSLSIIGRSLGSKNYEKAQNTFKTAAILIVAFAISYSLLAYVMSEQISRVLGADRTLMVNVTLYLKTFSPFLVFYPLMILTGFSDRIVGKPQLFLYATIATLLLNTSLSYVFVKYLALGIRGAALAMGIANTVGFVVTVRPMFNKKYSVNLFTGCFDKSTIVQMLYNGGSEGIGSASTALAIYLFNLEFMRRIGPSGVAAFTTISFVVQFGVSVIFGIADGVSPVVSYNFGHGQFNRVKEIMRQATMSGFVVGISVFILLITRGQELAGLFAKGDASVINVAASGATIYAFAFLVNSFNIIHSVYFTAIGGAKESALLAMSRGMIWIVLGLQLWPRLFGITGVWLTIPIAEAFTLLLLIYLVKKRPVELLGVQSDQLMTA